MAVLNVLMICSNPSLATPKIALGIAFISGAHIILLLTTAWIALPLVVVVCNSAISRSCSNQTLLASHAPQVLKLSLATLFAARKTVSCLTTTSQLTNANQPIIALPNVTSDSARDIELLLHLPHVVVLLALL
jgi:hypothetical protein